MQAYYLVASYRYSYRSNNQICYAYKNQVVIPKIENNKLSGLLEIDKFTSKNTEEIVIKKIKEEYREIGNINHLSIKYMRNLSSKPEYFDVICGDELFYNCINVSNDNKVNLENKTTLAVNTNSKLFVDEIRNFENMLIDEKKTDKEKCEEIKKMIPKRKNDKPSDLEYLVDNYFNTSIGDRGYVLGKIRLEFSRYKTFRGWYISKKREIKVNHQIPGYNKSGNIKKVDKKIVVATFDENMKDFDTRFESKHNMTYDQYRAQEHNLGDIYSDYIEVEVKEEFLDEDEYNAMVGYDEDLFREEFDSRSGGRRRR